MLDSRSVIRFGSWPSIVVCFVVLAGCGGTIRGRETGDGGPGGNGSGGSGAQGGRSPGGTGAGGVKNCPSPLSRCGSSCVDTQSSSTHCGACNAACTVGTSCVNGSCQSSGSGGNCIAGQTYCSSFARCMDLATNSFACGSCYAPCVNSEACINGVCVPGTCFPGLTDCGGPGFTECAELTTDRNNCGACRTACDLYESCIQGKCVPPECSPPYIYCPTSGCTDVTTDISNCGKCGNSCTLTGSVFDYSAYGCTNGTCGCAPLANKCGKGCATQFWFCPPDGFSGSPADLCVQTARNAYERCACQSCLAEVTSCAASSSCINAMDCALGSVCVGCGQAFSSCTDQQGQPDPLADKLVTCMNAACSAP